MLISGIILPRLLNPSALGRLNSLIALAAIVYSFAFLGMRSSLVIHLGKKKFEEHQILSALVYIFLLSIIISTLALLTFFFFLSNDTFPVIIILLVCLINPFEFIISYMQGYNLAMSRFGNFNRLKWVPKLVYLLAILVFVVTGSRSQGQKGRVSQLRGRTRTSSHFCGGRSESVIPVGRVGVPGDIERFERFSLDFLAFLVAFPGDSGLDPESSCRRSLSDVIERGGEGA